MVRNLGKACLAASLAPVLAATVTKIHSTKSYSMNRQELIRDPSGFSAHALISEENNTPQRVLHAMFEGNSGGFIEFYPEGLTWNGTGQFYYPLVSPTADESTIFVRPVLPPASPKDATFAIQSQFNLNFNAYGLYSVASSVRNIRDWGENMDTKKTNNPAAGDFTITGSKVTLRHDWPPGPNPTYYVQVDLEPVKAGSVTFAPKPRNPNAAGLKDYDTFSVTLTNPSVGAVLKMTTSTNQPMEVPLDKSDVLKAAYQKDDLAEGLTYLSHQSGWVAGSFRFLTYFGRDTLMTLMMLRDKVTETMFKNVVTAALARTRMDSLESGNLEKWYDVYSTSDSTGLLCHEDELGAFPWQNKDDPRPWRGDFKMLDSHFLVLPLLGYAEHSLPNLNVGDYLKTTVDRRLDNTKKTVSALLEANIKQILQITKPFADSPKWQNLLKIYHDTVGNWRDSNEGLYEGVYPMDVNVAFVPAALQVIADHGDAWYPGKDYATRAKSYVTVWKQNALDMFKVTVADKSALDANIANYVKDATVVKNQGNLAASLDHSTRDDLPPKYYLSLSLLPNGKPTGVLSTDYGLLLAYRDDLPEDVVAEAARAARVKFPRGLATEAGLVVSNPAYGWVDGVTNQTLIKIMDRTGYHGTVVWSWQHAMYNMGLKNYLTKYPNSGVAEALNVLWDSIEGNMDMVESEMWSWEVNAQTGNFKAKDLLEITGSGTEGNVAQLWSYAFIGESRPESTGSETTESVAETTESVAETTESVSSWVAGVGCGSLLLMSVSLVM